MDTPELTERCDREAALHAALQAAVDSVHRRRAGSHNCMLITADAPCDECRWLAQSAALGVVPRSP